jgi:small subunit ribosomal protein S1
LSHTAIFREEEEKNVKTATENTSSNASTNAPAATLGDNNDMLAALKAKMEKQRK